MTNDSGYISGLSGPHKDYTQLAAWLQQVMAQPQTQKQSTGENETSLELLLDSDYHLHFYQQLPDFILALLNNDAQAPYAALLYHLAGCHECHSSYLDLYDALQAAVYPQGPRPHLGQGTRTLAATPQRMLGHLCLSLISQAEALFRQSRREHMESDAEARSLLQLALSISARINQSMIRQQALHDLVRVANLFEDTPQQNDTYVYVYTPVLMGAGGPRSGKKTTRHIETPSRAPLPTEEPCIMLQSHLLEGTITQNGQTLSLHLQGLAEELRGHVVTIAVPLGALLEPVRWRGGNPRAIRCTTLVDATGALTTPLGETELQLSDKEERNLLEAMFMLLEVRAVDYVG